MSGSEQPPDRSDEDQPGRHGLTELIAERRAKRRRLQESDASAFPYAFAGAEPIAAILAAYGDLAAGDETEDAHRVAGRHRRAARVGQDRLPGSRRPQRQDPAARAPGRARRGGLRAHRLAGHRRSDRCRRRRAAQPQGRDLAARGPLPGARQGAAPAPRQPPRPQRRRDALPPARARPDRQRGRAAAVRRARAHHRRRAPLPRRGRLHRGRDAGPAAALRRRARAPLHHAPQRIGPRPLPADRHRALPQAAARRRPRARV